MNSVMSALMAAIASLKSADSLSARSFITWTVSFVTDSCSDLAHRLFLKPAGEPGLFWRAEGGCGDSTGELFGVDTFFSVGVEHNTVEKMVGSLGNEFMGFENIGEVIFVHFV